MYLWLWLRYAIGDRISTFWQANLDQIATFWQANLDCHIFAHYGIGFPRFSKLTWIRLPSFGILWIKLPHSSKLTFERIATFWHANSWTRLPRSDMLIVWVWISWENQLCDLPCEECCWLLMMILNMLIYMFVIIMFFDLFMLH